MTFTSPDGSGIFNLAALGGIPGYEVDIDTEAVADSYDNPTFPWNYSKDLDTWLAEGFDWVTFPVSPPRV